MDKELSDELNTLKALVRDLEEKLRQEILIMLDKIKSRLREIEEKANVKGN